MEKKRTISDIKREIRSLTNYNDLMFDKRVMELIKKIRKENSEKVAKLNAELAELESKKPKPKPRWPEDTPEDVLKECEEYWKGTTELGTFRIHCWNDKIICTGYPSGGYSTNGGWNPSPVTFYFISRTIKEVHNKAKPFLTLEGRQSQKKLRQKLEELSVK